MGMWAPWEPKQMPATSKQVPVRIEGWFPGFPVELEPSGALKETKGVLGSDSPCLTHPYREVIRVGLGHPPNGAFPVGFPARTTKRTANQLRGKKKKQRPKVKRNKCQLPKVLTTQRNNSTSHPAPLFESKGQVLHGLRHLLQERRLTVIVAKLVSSW